MSNVISIKITTTNVAGCKETVIDGKNGFLIPKWNPNILAEKMIYFIEHPEKINEMEDASHQIAIDHFDAQKVNERLLELLDLVR